MLNIFIDFQPEDLGRPTTGTTGNWYTRGSGRVENLTNGYGSGRLVKTVYPHTPSTDAAFRYQYCSNLFYILAAKFCSHLSSSSYYRHHFPVSARVGILTAL